MGSNKNIIFEIEPPQYSDIFSDNLSKLKQVSKLFGSALRTKEILTI